MSVSALSDLIGVLLPGGVAVGVVAIFQGIKSWREGKTTREETVIRRYQRLTRESEQRAKIAEQDEAYAIIIADYWRSCYADLHFEAKQRGLAIPERPQLPEKMKTQVTSSAQTRRRRRATEEIDEGS